MHFPLYSPRWEGVTVVRALPAVFVGAMCYSHLLNGQCLLARVQPLSPLLPSLFLCLLHTLMCTLCSAKPERPAWYTCCMTSRALDVRVRTKDVRRQATVYIVYNRHTISQGRPSRSFHPSRRVAPYPLWNKRPIFHVEYPDFGRSIG